MPTEGGSGDAANHHPADLETGVVTKRSPWSMADTVARLSAVVAARGLDVYAVIDHSAKAREHGLPLRDTTVLIVGRQSTVTQIIDAQPLAALDVPLRVVVWVDGHRTFVSYPNPAAIARRHGLDDRLRAALSSIDAVTNAVIDR